MKKLLLLAASAFVLAMPFVLQAQSLYQEKEVPEIFGELNAMLEEGKYIEAVARIDAELADGHFDFGLIGIKSYVQYKFLKDRTAALATVNDAIADNPRNFELYEFKIELLNNAGFEDAEERVTQVYNDIAVAFAARPDSLSEMGFQMLKKNLHEIRLKEAIILLKAAKDNVEKSSDSVKYLVLSNLARGYYFASRADLAAIEQEEALKYATENELPACHLQVDFYKEAARIAESL